MDFRDIKEFFKDSFKYIIVIVVTLLSLTYVVSLQQIIGPSMNPNYTEGNIHILNKIKYRFLKPKRFEVVVINNKEAKFLIKRIIGLPGDHVEYKNNELYINHVKVVETFNKNGDTQDYTIETLGYETIPKGYYFVLGDNRINSNDSRNFGLVAKKDIVGKVELGIWPLFRK